MKKQASDTPIYGLEAKIVPLTYLQLAPVALQWVQIKLTTGGSNVF